MNKSDLIKDAADKNWSDLVHDWEPLIGRTYIHEDGREFTFIGLLHGQDDFYFVMWREGEPIRLLTCVGVPEQMGFTLCAVSDVKP